MLSTTARASVSAYKHRRQLVLPRPAMQFQNRILAKADASRAPFRAGSTHVVQLGPVAIAYVHNQVVNDAGEVGDGLSRLASKTRHCGPARRSRCDRTGSDDAFPDHLFSPSGWIWTP